MNAPISPPKKHDDDNTAAADAEWEVFVSFSSKRQRRVLRFFAPGLIEDGVGPLNVRNENLWKVVQRLPSEAALKYSGQPGVSNRSYANSFVNVWNEINDEFDLDAPELSNFQTPTQARLQRFTSFETQFESDLQAIQIQRQRPRRNPRTGEERDRVQPTLTPAERKALWTCALVLQEHGVQVTAIDEIIKVDNFRIIKRRLRKAPFIRPRKVDADETFGGFVQTMGVLAGVARHYGITAVATEAAEQARKKKKKSGVSRKTMLRLAPFNKDAIFATYVNALFAATFFSDPKDLLSKVKLFRVQSAIAALILIFGLSRLELLHAARFLKSDSGERYLGLPATKENLEKHLPKKICGRLRALLAACSVIGIVPEAVFFDLDGHLRAEPLVRSSLQSLLAAQKRLLTPFELRDLAVMQAVKRGEKLAKIRRALRMTRRGFLSRYAHLIRNVRENLRKNRC